MPFVQNFLIVSANMTIFAVLAVWAYREAQRGRQVTWKRAMLAGSICTISQIAVIVTAIIVSSVFLQV